MWPCPHENARAVCPDCGATVSAASSMSAGADDLATAIAQHPEDDNSPLAPNANERKLAKAYLALRVSAGAGQVPADTIEKALRERAELARLVAFKTDFYALPQVVQNALFGLAALLEDSVDALEAAVARANQLEKALREIEARDYGYSPHGTKRDSRSTVQVIKDALAGVPAEPATEETRITYGGQFVQPVETRGVSPTHGEATIAASSVSAEPATEEKCHCGRTAEPRDPDPWEGRMDGYCYACALNRCDCYPDECPVRAASSVSAGTRQVPADTIEKAIVDVLRDRLGVTFGEDERDAAAAWKHVRRICREAMKVSRDPNYEKSGFAPLKAELARQVVALAYLALELRDAALAAVRTPEEQT